jgi:hypothetical protein
MDLLNTLAGEGWIGVDTPKSNRAQYAIGFWRDADGSVFGRGRISGEVETMFRASIAPPPLLLVVENGNSFNLTVTSRGAGNAWAEVYVSDPLL